MSVRSFLSRSFRDNVQLGTLLAFVAGNVNSIAFVQFGTYVSHVSGHATRASINYAEGHLTSAALFFMEFMAFIFGAGVTAFTLRGHTAASSQVKYTLPIFLEILLILIYLFSAVYDRGSDVSTPYISHLTFILAVAMGIQNAMLRQASGTVVRTTHITGVATDFGAALGAALRLGGEAFFKPQLSLFGRCSQSLRIFLERLRTSRFLFHSFILIAFSCGAIVGTIAYLLHQDFSLLIPVFVLLLLGIRELRRQPAPIVN